MRHGGRWSPVGTPRAAPTRRPGSPPAGGSPRRPSVRHNAPHAARRILPRRHPPDVVCALWILFFPIYCVRVPCRAPLPSPHASLWPAPSVWKRRTGPGHPFITNYLVEEKKQTHWPPPTGRSGHLGFGAAAPSRGAPNAWAGGEWKHAIATRAYRGRF
jgi:hypothetical protein